MSAVRYLLRVGVLVLAGFAVFCGLILLFNAQVLLNRYAELYMQDVETPLPGVDQRAVHQRALESFAANEPEHASPPAAARPQPAPAAVPAEGERAIAIRVSNAETVADVAAPDRWVDVILTHQAGNGPAFSETVLENVRVLAIETIAADGRNGKPTAAHAVTLDVDTDTAQNLLLASEVGRLSLVLRAPVDARRPMDAPQASIAEPVVSQSAAPQASIAEPANSQPAAPQASIAEPADSQPEARQASVSEPADSRPTSAQDDPHFTVVTVNRAGGKPSTHRVPRER